MLLLLSGDVELNPGPMIDDRPDISLLTQWLEPLVDWKPFGHCLPQLTYSDISKIEAENVKIDERKSALYSKWLNVAPTATWADVINALSRRRENKLVQDIRRNLQKSAPRSARSYRAITLSQEEVMFHSAGDEKTILLALIDLKKEFPILIMHTRLCLEQKIEKDPKILRSLTIWLEAYMHWNDKLTNASLDETFKIIHPFYDLIDCNLIVDMGEVFLKDFKFNDGDKFDIVIELNKYKDKADKLRFSAQVKHLHESLKSIYGKYMPDTSKMPMIVMKLHNQWHGSTINGLSLLIHNLLPVGHQQSIMKYITISSGSVIIKYSVHGSTADSLIESTGGKLQFIRLIGIFSLYINDDPVLQEDENMNFTFELALLEAVTAGNNEAVEFLLQLETVNIDHTNEENWTALMLACERGHEDIVHSLLCAGANVNIQDNHGWTALMTASEHNHISIIHMLLQANANPHLKKSNGSNALLIASYSGYYEVVELLISKGVDCQHQRKDGANAFMAACKNGHTQIVELLLKEQVDPNVQKEDGWNAFMLACQNGHTQIVKLLLKEKVDPNVQENSGGDAFMFACLNGHIQTVELLLKEQVNHSIQEEDGWNAFMLACQNGHIQIVELLLKEQVDPNIQKKDGWNAFMSACQNGHIQIVELLLKKQVDPNVQANDGVNAFMLACKNGDTQIVKLLLKKQVDPNVQEKNGWNAFMLACENGHTQIVKLLLKEQVDPNVQKKDGWNAFMLACLNSHTQLVKLLLNEQVDPNVQKEDGWNALMIASANGSHEIVKLLLESNADPTIKSNEGHTALSLAKTIEISALIKRFFKKGDEEDATSVYSDASSGYHSVSSGHSSTMRSHFPTFKNRII
uniref:Death domain-containing protein n=2 Tax=Amphimedon queenslandica TaxID=400682 RepID=A0A1X7V0L0_AMPQE